MWVDTQLSQMGLFIFTVYMTGTPAWFEKKSKNVDFSISGNQSDLPKWHFLKF